jgi:hypothetical protein
MKNPTAYGTVVKINVRRWTRGLFWTVPVDQPVEPDGGGGGERNSTYPEGRQQRNGKKL